jgi:urease accessory protein UreF
MAETMTNLETRCVKALRLSESAGTLLLEEIQSNIEAARAELLRSGVSSEKVEEDGALIQNAIIDYVLMQMNDEDQYERYFNAWQYEMDNLRKSFPGDRDEE